MGKKVYNPKTLNQKVGGKNNLDDKNLDNELAQKMNIPYYFADEKSQLRSKIILDSHNNNHAQSILSIIPFYTDLGIEKGNIKSNLKEMAINYARLINQYKFK